MSNPLNVEHYTNLWCRQKGIHAKDLENHPQADDVVLLIKFREQFWPYMDAKEQGAWASYWSWTYTRKFSLKQKYLEKLAIIGNSATFKKQKQQERIATIKAMRSKLNANAKEQNREVHMTANPSLGSEISQ